MASHSHDDRSLDDHEDVRQYNEIPEETGTSQEGTSQEGTSQTKFFNGSYFVRPGSNYAETKSPPHPFFSYTVPRWRYLFNTTLVLLDLLMTILATVIISLLYPEAYEYTKSLGGAGRGVITMVLLACCSWIISLCSTHCYERHTMGEGYALYNKLVKASFMDFIMLCTINYLFKLDQPRIFNALIPILTLMLTIIERWLARRFLHRHRREGKGFGYPTIIIGSPESIHDTIVQLRNSKSLGYIPIAVCPVKASAGNTPNAPRRLLSVPFTADDGDEAELIALPLDSHLPITAKYLKAQTVLIADVLTRDSETMRALSLAMESMGIELAQTASLADLNAAQLHFRSNPLMPVLTAQLTQYSTITRIFKRLSDIFFSLIAIIISSPIMLVVALLIKHEDGGPVFFRQQRIGIYGKPFTMYKFRSMNVNAEAIKKQLAEEYGMEDRFVFKLKNDPRVTRIGHFIRKTSIDEIPQFFNVLKGDMSLVGPRPPLPEEVARYGTLYSARLLVKPGITGPWQVSGRSNLTQEQSEFVDVSYIQNWSLTGDIAILLKTVVAVVRGTGSY